MNKTLLLVRHAHRDTTHRELDNGLSDKGKKQAASLLKYYERHSSATKPYILSSPRLRCIETVEPIARRMGAEIHRSPLLLEQEKNETVESFHFRVRDFFDWWKTEASELSLVCSHGDWLPLAVELGTGGRALFKKGSLAELVWNGRHAVLRTLLQHP